MWLRRGSRALETLGVMPASAGEQEFHWLPSMDLVIASAKEQMTRHSVLRVQMIVGWWRLVG